jgi:hypothetical protein
MREALRRRSTLLVVAALLAGGAGGFALGRATDESATRVGPPPPVGAGSIEERAVPPKALPKKQLRELCAISVPNPSAIVPAIRSLPSRCRRRLFGPPPSPPLIIPAPSGPP